MEPDDTLTRAEPRPDSGSDPDSIAPRPPADLPDLNPLIARLEQAVVGQRGLLERMVIALLAGGHVLIEGVPGLAKTRAVRALARALDLPFRRIQFTPDLLPADLTGTQVYHPQTGRFDVKHGPIVAGVLLADEINRAPAKVQSALLEAMQEGQVTIGDETIRLPDPFFVLATQNPIEQEGTYPLPEAQLDRFLMKLLVGYPDREAELSMLDLPGVGAPASHAGLGRGDGIAPADAVPDPAPPLLGPAEVRALRAFTGSIRVAPALKGYIVDLIRATRVPHEYGLDLGPLIELGASPRATLALVRSSQGHALLSGRDYVTPFDVKSVARDVLRHRLLVSYEADAEGLSPDDVLGRILDHIRVP
jgi:MoxR-like ATPase